METASLTFFPVSLCNETELKFKQGRHQNHPELLSLPLQLNELDLWLWRTPCRVGGRTRMMRTRSTTWKKTESSLEVLIQASSSSFLPTKLPYFAV